MFDSGNLAYEPVFPESDGALDWGSPAPSAARRILLEDPANRPLSLPEKAKKVRRTLAIRRLKNLASLIAMIVCVTSIFGGILYRQAMILEGNFNNLKLEREIKKTIQATGQIEESLAAKTNLEQIKLQAINRLGLQEPARKQIIVVDIPNSDRVVYASSSNQQVNPQAQLADCFTQIEGFFKTLTIPGQTP